MRIPGRIDPNAMRLTAQPCWRPDETGLRKMLASGLDLAIASSTFFNLGIALQALEAREAPAGQGLRVSLLLGLVRRRRWLGGLLLGALGAAAAGRGLRLGALRRRRATARLRPTGAVGDRPAPARREPTLEALLGVAAIIAGIGLIAWGAPGQQDTHRGAAAVLGVMSGLVAVSLTPFAPARSALRHRDERQSRLRLRVRRDQRGDEADGRRLWRQSLPAGGGVAGGRRLRWG